MSIVLTAHAIASINCAKYVAGQLGCSLYWGLLVVLNWDWHDFDFLCGSEHFMDGIEGSWTVITHQHRCAASVVLGQNLSATSRATMGIELAQMLITQILVTFRMTWSNRSCSFSLTQGLQVFSFFVFFLYIVMCVLSGRITTCTIVSKNR